MDEFISPDLLDVVYNLGDYVIFLWLYITERRAHEATQTEFDEYLKNQVKGQ